MNNKNILDKYSKTFIDVFNSAFENKSLQFFLKSLDVLIDIYKKANENNIYIDIWNYISRNYFNYLRKKEIEFESFMERFINLHFALEKNIFDKSIQTHAIEQLTVGTYSCLKKNIYLEDYNFDDTWEEFIRTRILYGYEDLLRTKGNSKKRIIARKKEALNTLKYLIDNNDEKFNLLFFDYLLRFSYANPVIINIAVYLYYLACREKDEYLSKEQADSYKKLIETNNNYFRKWIDSNILNLGNLSSEIIIDYNWERSKSKYNNHGKQLIMDEVVTEFTIFINTISEDPKNIEYILNNPIINNSAAYLLLNYFSEDTCEQTIKKVIELNQLFYHQIEESKIKSKINNIKEKLRIYHKKNLINQVNVKNALFKTLKTEETLSEKVNIIANNVLEHFNSKKEEEPVQLGNALLYSINTNVETLENIEWLNLEEYAPVYLFNLFLRVLNKGKERIKIKKVSFMENKAIEHFLNLIKKYPNLKSNIIIDSNNIKYHGTKEEMDQYETYIRDFEEAFSRGSHNATIVLDKELIYFKITNVSVNIRSLNAKEIEEYNYNDEYKYQDVTKIDFEKQDFIDFISKKKKVIEIYCQYEYSVSDLIGLGVKFDFHMDKNEYK